MLILGDSREELRRLEPSSIDAVVCDPPYGLSNTTPAKVSECLAAWARGEEWSAKGGGFMGKDWDSWVPPPQLWKEVFRVLKPGGHLLAFASARTQDLMSISLRLAGFEVRDCIQWLYGSGFPKSHNLKDDWAGYGTALKPAFEPAILCRKPIEGTVAENVLKYGVGAINIDGCRIETDEDLTRVNHVAGIWSAEKKTHIIGSKEGRWPANVILDDSFNQPWARYFYSPKASKEEREAGLIGDGERANVHPTVKPIELMRYLCKLITPPQGTVLDPFMGSGSTGIAAGLEGFNFIGIEREAEYFEIARARIEHWVNTPLTYEAPKAKEVKTGGQLTLF